MNIIERHKQATATFKKYNIDAALSGAGLLLGQGVSAYIGSVSLSMVTRLDEYLDAHPKLKILFERKDGTTQEVEI
jgi:hypothetical protein